MSLPKGYKRLEYIQSSGTQYLDTLFKPNNNTRVVMDVELPVQGSYPKGLFGVRDATSGNKNSFLMWVYDQSFNTGFATVGKAISLTTSGRFTVDKNKTANIINGTTYSADTASTFQSSYSLLLLALMNSNGVDSRMVSGKLYSCQIYDNGTLVRYYVPCINDSGAVGLWDDANGVFYGNAGTGTFAAGPVVSVSVDENEITELEYIQSNGTQYIDTGFKPNQNSGVTIDFQMTAVSGWQCLFGADNTGGNVDIYSIWHTGSAFGFYYAKSNKTWSGLNGTARHTIVASKNTAVADGSSSVSITASTFTTNYPLTLFMMNYRGTIGNGASMKLFSCQIYDNGLLERDYIPAMLTNGEVGLYDRVFHEFCRNAGTGEFIAGPEVQTVPKAPKNFRVVSESVTMVTLAWDASDKAVGYRLYRAGQLLADTEETSVSVEVEPFAGGVFTLTAYNENGEGAGTELIYFNAPDDPILFLVTDRTQQDVAERNPKGYYAARDLNRVGYAVDYLQKRLLAAGVSVAVSPVLAWTDEEWATPSAMTAYLKDVQTMRNALKVAETTPTAPEDMAKLTYSEANDIEAILAALDVHITQMLSIVDAGWASGLAYTGFYFKEAY